MNLLTAFGEGLFIVPLLPFIGFCIFMYQAYKASKSNSTTDMGTHGIKDNTGNVPIYKTGYFVLAIGCLLGAIGATIWILLEK